MCERLALSKYLTMRCPNWQKTPCTASCSRCRGWLFIIKCVEQEVMRREPN
jgi:hypothetical protein